MAFCALIPTAGRSQRMGSAKAWLRYDGEPLLCRIVTAAVDGGAAAVVVVAGSEDQEDPRLVSRIEVAVRVATPENVRLSVALGKPDGELIDSIRSGYELVAEGMDLLMWPVDAPFATAALVRDLTAALGGNRDRVAVPVINGRRGHPTLLGVAVAAELITAVADGGAHLVVRRDPARVIGVPAQDPRVVRTLNTPADAAALGVELP